MEEKNRAEQLVECGNRYSAAGGSEWDDAAARKCYEQAVTLGSPEAACRLSEMLLTGKGGPKNRRRSAQLCKAAAEQGLLQAIYRLGWMYLSGTEGLATDWAEGLKWIEQAARKGCWEAMFDLACMYRDGDFGLEKDCPKAVLWFGAAAEAGMPAAYRHLAELYMWEQWEKDIPEHREEAIRYYHLGAEAGDEECMNRMGLRCCSGGTIWKNDIPAAVEWMRKSAGAGNGDAMLLLGELYEREWDGLFGREISAYWSCRGAKAGSPDAWQALRDSHWPQTGFAREIEEAHKFVCALTARYYRWAAEAGDAVAMNNLGVVYETGQGVEQDELQAMYWYDQAAGHGLGTAVENLGWQNPSWEALTREAALAALVRLRSGGTYTLGLAREHRTIDESRYGEKALRWYGNSPRLHTPEGMRIIGWSCDHGRYGMARDGVAAAQWYLRAAAAGDPKGMLLVGRAYAEGLGGFAVDRNEAVRWYFKSARAGSAEAMCEIGRAYQLGHGGLEQDAEKAARWFFRSARAGDPDGMYQVGRAYARGSGGLPADPVQAGQWYRKAAQAGSPDGMLMVGRAYWHGRDGLPEDKAEAARWYLMSAQFGHPEGMYMAGWLYANGHGPQGKNVAGAVQWLQYAQEAGWAEAGVYMQEHRAEIADGLAEQCAHLQNHAARWCLEKSVELGSALGAYRLGKSLMEERGEHANPDRGVALCRQAAEQGVTQAMLTVAYLYLSGSAGFEENEAEGLCWVERTTNTHTDALLALGELYKEGDRQIGWEVDTRKAVYWYEKAAATGSAHAYRQLGDIHRIGVGYYNPDAINVREFYQQGALLGDAFCMYKLGECYENGWGGLERDAAAAVDWYRKGAEAGCELAVRKVALAYEQGLGGLQRDDAAAVEWFRRGAEKKDRDCVFKLSLAYEAGRGNLQRDMEKAEALMREAAELGHHTAEMLLPSPERLDLAGKGDAKSMRRLAEEYLDKDALYDLSEAFRWLKMAAEAGDIEAQYALGRGYAYGWYGLEEDAAQAAVWLEKASTENSGAMYDLARLYEKGGSGLEMDRERAITLLRWAATNVNASPSAKAMYDLAILYEMGAWGFPKGDMERFRNCEVVEGSDYWYEDMTVENWCRVADYKGAWYFDEFGDCYTRGAKQLERYCMTDGEIQWFRKLGEVGYPDALHAISLAADEHCGGLADDEVMVRWLFKAATAGDSGAIVGVAWAYATGQGGLPENPAESVRWLYKAAEAGESIAMYRLGIAYDTGSGVDQDYAESFRWYQRAAQAGNEMAFNSLGCAYEDGEGVEKDLEEAARWYRKAADAGDVDGMYNLGNFYKTGQGVAQNEAEAVRWYLAAAQEGDPDGMYEVGLAYAKGYGGLSKNEEQARSWWECAARAGHETAEQLLKDCGIEDTRMERE